MPDVIQTVSTARALAERLADTVPPFTVTVIPSNDAEWRAAWNAYDKTKAGEQPAIRFLLDAVGWNVELLAGLSALDELPTATRRIVDEAWGWAEAAIADPNASRDGDESPAAALAYFALVGSVDPGEWRECDRTAALDVLPLVSAHMHEHPEDYLYPARDIDDARLTLIMLEPSMPDHRHDAIDGKAAH